MGLTLTLSDPRTSYFQAHKSENGDENKEVNGVADEEEEDDDEDDESSDPDIEEEIQASTQQDGPGKSRDIDSSVSSFSLSVGFPAAGKECQHISKT